MNSTEFAVRCCRASEENLATEHKLNKGKKNTRKEKVMKCITVFKSYDGEFCDK